MRERLYRSRQDRMIFGVAGGMAEWMDLDPAIVRLVWALLILAGGVGLVLYIVAAIVIPEAPLGVAGGVTTELAATGQTPGAQPRARRGAGNSGVIFGLVLVIAGAWFLVDRYVENLDKSWVIPGLLIVIGIALVFGALGRSRGQDVG
jgi:phage shock protein C